MLMTNKRLHSLQHDQFCEAHVLYEFVTPKINKLISIMKQNTESPSFFVAENFIVILGKYSKDYTEQRPTQTERWQCTQW